MVTKINPDQVRGGGQLIALSPHWSVVGLLWSGHASPLRKILATPLGRTKQKQKENKVQEKKKSGVKGLIILPLI